MVTLDLIDLGRMLGSKAHWQMPHRHQQTHTLKHLHHVLSSIAKSGGEGVCPITIIYLYFVKEESTSIGRYVCPWIEYHIKRNPRDEVVRIGLRLSEDGPEKKHGTEEAKLDVARGSCICVRRGRGV